MPTHAHEDGHVRMLLWFAIVARSSSKVRAVVTQCILWTALAQGTKPADAHAFCMAAAVTRFHV